MKRSLFNIILLCASVFMVLELSAQPILRPILQNKGIRFYAPKNSRIASESAETHLPFIDDFSYSGPYPNPKLWSTNQVLVNANYPLFPPTLGVATFDALDEKGSIYPSALITGMSFSADTLCSHRIRLDSVWEPYPRKLSPADSVWLSFYYQPGGGYGDEWGGFKRGYVPRRDDKLVLEAYSEPLSIWVSLWETKGLSLSDFADSIDKDTSLASKNFFRRVNIPIRAEHFFNNKFQIRFRAYSSIDPNYYTGGGQWHIDYVYLDYDRKYNEEGFMDIAFVEPAPSLLKDYYALPLKHFAKESLRKDFAMAKTNLEIVSLSCRYRYYVYDAENKSLLYAYPESGEANANIFPFSQNAYKTDPDISTVPFTFDFSASAMPNSVQVIHVLKSGIQGDLIETNDTVIFEQSFSDEMALDDGSPESGIGMTFADAMMAQAFDLSLPDTLNALRIYFQHSLEQMNKEPFKICVWKTASNGEPGELIYEGENLSPDYTFTEDGFTVYRLKETLPLAKGRYFFGIKQISSAYTNIGFDRNTNHSEQIYYFYLDRQTNNWRWNQSIFAGTLMIRPRFGKFSLSNESLSHVEDLSLTIYPNPTTDGRVNIVLPKHISSHDFEFSVYDVYGRLMKKGIRETSFSVRGLSRGVYFVFAHHIKQVKRLSAKLTISK